MTCSVPECQKPVRARGFCIAHWKRWRRYGDPLAGRIAHGEARRFFQDVVLTYKGSDCLLWPYGKRPNGYGQHHDEHGKTRLVHRMACEAIHGEPEDASLDVAHSCGVRLCVNPQHLRWATRAQNLADRVLHGTSNRGERSATAKLQRKDVLAIRSLSGIVPQGELAARFGVTQQTISDIQTGRRWSWLKGELQEVAAKKYLEGLL